MPSHRAILAVVAAAVALGVAALAVVVLVRDDDAIQANGDLIAFSCKEPKNTWYAICIANSDGTDRRRITKQMETSNPAWSPNGQQIAFTRNEEVGEYLTYTEDDVFVMDADGDNVRQLTPERDGRHALRPGWSPDGREIAFVLGESVPSGYPRFGDLFVIDVNEQGLAAPHERRPGDYAGLVSRRSRDRVYACRGYLHEPRRTWTSTSSMLRAASPDA